MTTARKNINPHLLTRRVLAASILVGALALPTALFNLSTASAAQRFNFVVKSGAKSPVKKAAVKKAAVKKAAVKKAAVKKAAVSRPSTRGRKASSKLKPLTVRKAAIRKSAVKKAVQSQAVPESALQKQAAVAIAPEVMAPKVADGSTTTKTDLKKSSAPSKNGSGLTGRKMKKGKRAMKRVRARL